jgi:hypothetical protein
MEITGKAWKSWLLQVSRSNWFQQGAKKVQIIAGMIVKDCCCREATKGMLVTRSLQQWAKDGNLSSEEQ